MVTSKAFPESSQYPFSQEYPFSMLIEIEAYDEDDRANERLMNFLELSGDIILVS